MLLKPISFLRKAAGGGGGTTRRKLISTSNAADTGMHSTANITMAADDVTLAFWWRPTDDAGTNAFKTLWAGNAGNYQVSLNGSTASEVRNIVARMDGANSTAGTTGVGALNSWNHVVVYMGEDHAATKDVRTFINGSEEVSVTASNSSTEMTTAGTHYLLGDDASGSPTDGGVIGEVFDVCVLDGIVDIADLNYDAGDWTDLTSTGLAALKYRIDGQNASDPGEDSSGNGHDFTVENSGVTLSDSGLPTGANP